MRRAGQGPCLRSIAAHATGSQRGLERHEDLRAAAPNQGVGGVQQQQRLFRAAQRQRRRQRRAQRQQPAQGAA